MSFADDTPSSPIGMCHVASWRNQICSSWSANPNQEDGSVLRDARPIITRARRFLEAMFSEREVEIMLDPAFASDAAKICKSYLMVRTHREVLPTELDVMPPDVRETAIAIRNTDRTAIPHSLAEIASPTMAQISTSKTSKIEIHLLPDDEGVMISAISQKKGQKQHTIFSNEGELRAECAQLFRVPEAIAPPDKIPIISRPYNFSESNAMRHIEMPSWMAQRVGQVLQDGFRLHALLTAAATADVCRAVIIDKAFLSTPLASSSRGCELVARLHKTSATCICVAHQHKPPAASDSFVQTKFAFCGKQYSCRQNRRCVRHVQCASNFVDELPVCCLHNLEAMVTCRHTGTGGTGGTGGREPYNLRMDIPTDSVERLRILSAASVALLDNNKHEALQIKNAVDAVFTVVESCETPNSEANIFRDFDAVRLIRRGGVQQTIRGGKVCLSCSCKGSGSGSGSGSSSSKGSSKLTRAEHGLCTTHAHLFKKR